MPFRRKANRNSRTEVGSSEKQDDVKIPRPIAFWSENERDAFRRNRVVQTRCMMILEVINTQRETSKRAIRFEAHKFRQKREKSLRQQGTSIKTDVPNQFSNSLPQPENGSDTSRSDKIAGTSDTKHTGDDENIEKESIIFPKLTGIITHTRKSSVRFSISGDETDGITSIEGDEKTVRSSNEKQRRPNSEKVSRPTRDRIIRPSSEKQEHTETGSEFRPFVSRSLSDFCLRDKSEDSRLLRRQKSAHVSFRARPDYNMDARSIGDIESLPRSETFFVKSKAAYQLRQDLKRQAILRKQGVSQKTVTLSDYLDAERGRYTDSSEKIQEYIKRIDTEKMFRPLMINKWTATDIGKQL